MDVRAVPVALWPTTIPLPNEFTLARITPPVHQGECGACWAIASASCFADRAQVALTPAGYMDVAERAAHCVRHGRSHGCNSKCGGGFMITGLMYIRDVGYLVDPGNSSGGANRQQQQQQRLQCAHVYRCNLYDMFGVTGKAYIERPSLTAAQLRHSAANIAREVYLAGAVCATFNIFSDFSHFWTTEDEVAVYRLGMYDRPCANNDTQGSKGWTAARPGPGGKHFLVSHSVVIVGFGTDADTNVPYWLCRSSWGRPHNRPRGLFRIVRGVNMCGIESDVLACAVRTHDACAPLVPLRQPALVTRNEALALLALSGLAALLVALRNQ